MPDTGIQFIHSCWEGFGQVVRGCRCTGVLHCALGCLAAVAASAQQVGYDDEVVTCESRDMGWVHCDIEVANGVDLVRQLSSNSCIRGSEWGTDRSGVWVTLGCRAEFRARRARRGAAGWQLGQAPGAPCGALRIQWPSAELPGTTRWRAGAPAAPVVGVAVPRRAGLGLQAQ